MTRPISVVVAEQNKLVRAGLSVLLEHDGRCNVLGEATGLDDLMSVVDSYDPCVLVTEVCFDGVHGYDQLTSLSRSATRRLNVVVVSDHREPRVIRETIRTGVGGYLPKDSTVEELHSAVRVVADGANYLHPQLGCVLVGRDECDECDSITGREKRVLELAARGLTTIEVSDRLFVSTRSVEAARASVREKIGITTRAELYTFASDHGLLRSSCSASPPDTH